MSSIFKTLQQDQDSFKNESKGKKEQFLTFVNGDNKFRIMSNPLPFYQFFINKKPFNHEASSEDSFKNFLIFYKERVDSFKPEYTNIRSSFDLDEFKNKFKDWNSQEFKLAIKEYSNNHNVITYKKVFSFVVFDYSDEKIKCLTISQSTIISALDNTVNKEGMDQFTNYDMCVTRKTKEGSTKHTDVEYVFTAMNNRGSIDLIDLKTKEGKDIICLYNENPCDLNKLVLGEYPFDDVDPDNSTELLIF